MPRKCVLVVGGSGRTGARLVQRLCADPALHVIVLARDPSKAIEMVGPECGSFDIIQGDLLDLEPWAHRLADVDQIVTAVSCGVRTDPLVLCGLRAQPQNMPHLVDYAGVAKLAEAARSHDVQRIVAVTSASTGTPWSAGALLLNTVCFMSIKWKFFGEQAIRRSGVDFIIIRPFGLVETPPGVDTELGIEVSQGRTEGTQRRIPREDVARLCHEALQQPKGTRLTFECWATDKHRKPLVWQNLQGDPADVLPEVDHDTAVAGALTGLVCVGGLTSVGLAKGVRRMLRMIRR